MFGASAATVSSVASRSGTAATSFCLSSASSLRVGTEATPPGTMVVGWVVRPPMSEPHSWQRRFSRRARATTSGMVSTSGNTEGAPARSGATRM